MKVKDLGQSIWLDFFDREIITSGKLKAMITEEGIGGVTSNPSIFDQAITSSSDYDEDISSLGQTKKNAGDIFFSLAVKDIKRAADLFKNVYKDSNGEDGFVSLEVSPHLAHNTEGTIKQAEKLWKLVNRQNVMIKIPATREGLPAIRKCISKGININITLLFGLPRYKEVTEAYISGLEDRLNNNQPISNIASVASFFLSRIDVMIDPILKRKEIDNLKGEAAIASAKLAYQMYNEIFFSERFKKLEESGAKRQKVLWASTSSKDPSFSDVKYVEALIGNETINTLPLKTIEAFNDHGKVESHLKENTGKASDVLNQLASNNIDIDNITQRLENEGIEKFNKAYDQILKSIEKKLVNHLSNVQA
jgi:transaldolase/transaldolase/glucose-6-phosphate isomerase